MATVSRSWSSTKLKALLKSSPNKTLMEVWPADVHFYFLSFALLRLPTISNPVLFSRCWDGGLTAREEIINKTTCSHLQEEGLNLGNFARGDTLERGVLPGVHLYVTQPREMRHLVCGRRARDAHTQTHTEWWKWNIWSRASLPKYIEHTDVKCNLFPGCTIATHTQGWVQSPKHECLHLSHSSINNTCNHK